MIWHIVAQIFHFVQEKCRSVSILHKLQRFQGMGLSPKLCNTSNLLILFLSVSPLEGTQYSQVAYVKPARFFWALRCYECSL